MRCPGSHRSAHLSGALSFHLRLVTHSSLDLSSCLFFFLFILFFKILSPNRPPLALLSVDRLLLLLLEV